MTPVERYNHERPLHTYLPVTLGNGEIIKRFVVRCVRCDTEFEDDHLRGDVVMRKGAAIFRSVDACHNCRTVTYSMAYAIPKAQGGYVLEFPASYPVRVPWREDEADFERISRGEQLPVMPGDWVSIAQRIMKPSKAKS